MTTHRHCVITTSARSIALTACAMLVPSSHALAQALDSDPYFTPTKAKSTKHMPRVIIRNMRQDRAGNIWFATFGGPIRYDGEQFENFGQEVGLARTRIFSLLEDHTGAMWFGSITRGASRYDGMTATVFEKSAATRDLPDNDVLWVFEDRDHNVWLASNQGVSRYDGKSMTHFTTKDGLPHNSVYSIAQAPSGEVWFGTQGGVCSFDGTAFTDLAGTVGRTFQNVRAMAVDQKGHLWFGGQGGAYRFDGEKLTTFTPKDGLLQDFVGFIIVGRNGDIWMAHPGSFPDFRGGGATRYDGKQFHQYSTKHGLTVRTVYSLLEDKAGNIWFGSAGEGACRYDGKTFTDMSVPTSLGKPAKRSR